MLLWAVVFRLCGLVGGPSYEDDFYRYPWDGYRYAAAGTPYGVAPEAFFADPGIPQRFQEILSEVDNPDLPTIYPPVTQLIFLFAYWLQPGSVLALQAVLIAVDLVTVALLLQMAPARQVMLYAWRPLVIKEIAFTAHPDGVGACLLLSAILLGCKRRWSCAAICLSLAAGAKVFALILVPFVLAGSGFRHWMQFGATIAALYLPFALMGGTDLDSLQVFAREWEFNSTLFGLAAMAVGPLPARQFLGLAFVAF